MSRTSYYTIKWARTGDCQYQAEVDGDRYLLAKNKVSGEWHMYKLDSAAVENNKRARNDLSFGLMIEWELVKPHKYLYSFGTSLKKAQANAVLVLKRGYDAEHPEWQD